MRIPACHPDRKYLASGLCSPCYVSKKRNNRQLSELGLTQDQVDSASSCDICFIPIHVRSRLHLDHDHSTGQFRGFLCSKCNHGLGLFQDNPDLLRSAAGYLESYLGLAGTVT